MSRYGDFTLTEAVRPSYDLQVVPSQGYRHDYYRDEQNHSSVPVLMAAVSRERLFETFMDLLDPLGFTVDVVLETSHNRHNKGHTDLYREHIDLPVLKSVLWEYEDMLLNDGCTGLAVLNPGHSPGNPVRRTQAADRLRRPVAGVREHSPPASASAATSRFASSPRPNTSIPPATSTPEQFDELKNPAGHGLRLYGGPRGAKGDWDVGSRDIAVQLRLWRR